MPQQSAQRRPGQELALSFSSIGAFVEGSFGRPHEAGNAFLRLWIIHANARESTNPPHALRLLRAPSSATRAFLGPS
jgi:hypothetical protein